MRARRQVEALADLLVWYAELLPHLLGRRADRHGVHHVPPQPVAASEIVVLLYDENLVAHRGELAGGRQARGTGPDYDDVGLGPLHEDRVELGGDRARDVGLAGRREHCRHVADAL